MGQVAHVLRTRSPLSQGKPWFSLDLHVLGAPPAFVLSQDQTLHRDRDPHSSHVGGSSRLRSESCLFVHTMDEEATLCLPTRGPCRHGIDMSLRLADLTSDSRWRHWLLAFTALFSRSGSPTSAPVTEAGERTDVEATRTRVRGREQPAKSSVGVNRAPPFRATFEGGKPACGATDETTCRRCACQTGATPVSRPAVDPRCAGTP